MRTGAPAQFIHARARLWALLACLFWVASASAAPQASSSALEWPITLDPTVVVPSVANMSARELAERVMDLVRQSTPLPPNEASRSPDESVRVRVAATAGDALQSSQTPVHVEVAIGQPDGRLKLADCARASVFLPANARLWGNARVGVRCELGAVRWTVFLPVTVRVWARGVTLATPLAAAATIDAANLKVAEVDLAADPSPAVLRPEQALGREVAHDLPAGHSLRLSSFKPRRYFAVGDFVVLVIQGKGFSVTGEGQAMAPGEDGQCARIRTQSGRVVCARATGERTAEINL